MDGLSHSQQVTLAIAPKITAFLSIFGTCYVIRNVLISKRKRRLVYHRILLCISGIDLIIGICMFLSTWPIPSSTGIYGAVGTTQTCTAQGFFLQFSIMAPLYNAALSLYYLLMIRYNWTEERMHRLRLPVHGTILFFGLGTSIAGLFLTLYNPATLWCWQNHYPVGCIESLQSNDGMTTTCQRGDNALSVYRWAFFYAPLWCAIAFATVAMILVFWKVHTLEIKSDRFRSTRYSLEHGVVATSTPCGGGAFLQRPGERARKVARQALCYVGAFYLTWIWSTLTRILQSAVGKTYFSLVLLTAIFLPFQGFLNFLVYVRPRLERYREQHPDWSIWNALREVLCHVCHLLIPKEDEQEEDDYNVALTEAEMRSIFATEADEEKEPAMEYNNDTDTSNGKTEQAVKVSFQEAGMSNESMD